MVFGFKRSEDSASQKTIDREAEMLIKRLEKMNNSHRHNDWIGRKNGVGMPQDVSGRSYSGSNSFSLQLLTADKGYKMPVFMTAGQAHKLGVKVSMFQKPFPLISRYVVLRDKDGNTISPEDYKAMSKEERKEKNIFKSVWGDVIPVYNVDQTNLKKVKPELYAKLAEQYRPIELKDTTGMYVNRELDRMVSQKEWVRPIVADSPNDRTYSPPERDVVVIPMKAQFDKGGPADVTYAHGQEYYGRMLNEMARSILMSNSDGVHSGNQYLRHELAAELTAATVGNSLGFDHRIGDRSARHLDNWIHMLKEEPHLAMSIMIDVNKASDMILSHIDKQRMALDMPTLQCKTDSEAKMRMPEYHGDREVSVIRTKNGETSVRMNVASRKFETELNNHSQKKESALKMGM